ncbi:MAG: hypothetical protein L3J53_03180 [Proteobacteria bacterium]|nr:hypothetical protein [Pseudomonadota bacterium]
MDHENKNNTHNNTDTPWYKIPMVWLVITLPLIVVIASMATVVIAFKNAPQVLEYNASYKSDGDKPTR